MRKQVGMEEVVEDEDFGIYAVCRSNIMAAPGAL